jgi:hypothetical protein
VTAILLKERSPLGASAAGYLPPGPLDRPHDALDLLILRRIPQDVLHANQSQHRIVVWATVPRLPFAMLAPLLRHELEHAAQFQRYGKPLLELNAALLEAWMPTRGHAGYLQLPIERQANLAAARYAHERLHLHTIERAIHDRNYRQLFDAAAPELEGDVLDLTVAALHDALDDGAELVHPLPAGELDDLERRAREGPAVLDRLPHAGPELVVARPLLGG